MSFINSKKNKFYHELELTDQRWAVYNALYLETIDRKSGCQNVVMEIKRRQSNGLATYIPRLLWDGHLLTTGNLVGQKPPGVCPVAELGEGQHIVHNTDKYRGTVAPSCPTEDKED